MTPPVAEVLRDCPEDDDYGAGCAPLQTTKQDVAKLQNRVGLAEEHDGQVLVALGEVKSLTESARSTASKAHQGVGRLEHSVSKLHERVEVACKFALNAQHAAEKTATTVFSKVNEMVAAYQSSPPPPSSSSLFSDTLASEITKTHIIDPMSALGRIRKAEADTRAAVEERTKIEVARVLAEKAKEEALARAARIERIRLWVIAIAAIIAPVGAGVGFVLGMMYR
jgi:type I site-specific restriction endonuclease